MQLSNQIDFCVNLDDRAPLADWGGSELIIRLQAGSIPAGRISPPVKPLTNSLPCLTLAKPPPPTTPQAFPPPVRAPRHPLLPLGDKFLPAYPWD